MCPGTNNEYASYSDDCPTVGCTDSGAYKFLILTTIDDGSCLIAGCTYEDASNYNSGKQHLMMVLVNFHQQTMILMMMLLLVTQTLTTFGLFNESGNNTVYFNLSLTGPDDGTYWVSVNWDFDIDDEFNTLIINWGEISINEPIDNNQILTFIMNQVFTT